MENNPTISIGRSVGFPNLPCDKNGFIFAKVIILKYVIETMRQIAARQFVAALIG